MTEKAPLEQALNRARALFNQPFLDLLHEAHQSHRAHWPVNEIQTSTLLNVKTGRCPENCAYCPQSGHYETGLKAEGLFSKERVRTAALAAKEAGSSRFCMGAAWRAPTDKDLEQICELVAEVKALGMESCVTLGLLKPHQAERLKAAGVDFYNHNIDTSPDFYSDIISTRTFQDRLDTLAHVRASGMKVCSGGILGMGETNDDRLTMLLILSQLDPQPESVPINRLIPIPGTPLEQAPPIDPFEFVRTVAVARILMPATYLRLSAGRGEMSDELQALCFFAGVNSIHHGEKLLITPNPKPEADDRLFERLGLYKKARSVTPNEQSPIACR